MQDAHQSRERVYGRYRQHRFAQFFTALASMHAVPPLKQEPVIEETEEKQEAPVNRNLLQSLQEKVQFQYQLEMLTQLPAKVTASELAGKISPEAKKHAFAAAFYEQFWINACRTGNSAARIYAVCGL